MVPLPSRFSPSTMSMPAHVMPSVSLGSGNLCAINAGVASMAETRRDILMMHCRKRQGHLVHVGSNFVVPCDNQRREVLLVDGRIAEARGGHTGGGDAGDLGAALQRAGEVGHCSCGAVERLLQSHSENRASVL